MPESPPVIPSQPPVTKVRLSAGRYAAGAAAVLSLLDFGALIAIQATHRPKTGQVTIGQIWGEAIPWSILGVTLGISALVTYLATLLREEGLTNRNVMVEMRQFMSGRFTESDASTVELAGQVREAAEYRMAVEAQGSRALASDLFEKAMKTIDEATAAWHGMRSAKAIEDLREEFDAKLTNAIVEILRTQENPNVVAFDQRRRPGT